MMKVAFITGAAGGIGQAMAENFLKEGYLVALVDFSTETLTELQNTLADKYELSKEHQPLFFNINISDKDQVKAAVDSVMKHFGRVDVLFNGAGIARIGGITMSHQDFQKIIEVNLFGTFNCIHE